MARLSIRIILDSGEKALGPGMAELLERIDDQGSLRRAALSMGMSYRKAWLLIQGMQKHFGGAVLATTTGGASGGGAKLTPLGRQVLKTYRRIEARAAAAAAADLRALAGLSEKSETKNRAG
jgi:molybdate transport system regulatory protein